MGKLARQGNQAPESGWAMFQCVIRSAQIPGSKLASHSVTQPFHFRRFPAGKMLLQIIIARVMLFQKTAGREKDHSFPRDLFHVRHQLQTVRLSEMFDDIQRKAGVELARLKMFGQIADVTLHQLVMGVPPLGFQKRGFVALSPTALRNTKLPHRKRNPAAHIQHAVTTFQCIAQS